MDPSQWGAQGYDWASMMGAWPQYGPVEDWWSAMARATATATATTQGAAAAAPATAPGDAKATDAGATATAAAAAAATAWPYAAYPWPMGYPQPAASAAGAPLGEPSRVLLIKGTKEGGLDATAISAAALGFGGAEKVIMVPNTDPPAALVRLPSVLEATAWVQSCPDGQFHFGGATWTVAYSSTKSDAAGADKGGAGKGGGASAAAGAASAAAGAASAPGSWYGMDMMQAYEQWQKYYKELAEYEAQVQLQQQTSPAASGAPSTPAADGHAAAAADSAAAPPRPPTAPEGAPLPSASEPSTNATNAGDGTAQSSEPSADSTARSQPATVVGDRISRMTPVEVLQAAIYLRFRALYYAPRPNPEPA
eukprot:EG_transcript_15986